MKCRDDDGKLTGAGDMITFSYGIPPVRVEGWVAERGGSLWVMTSSRLYAVKLRSLRTYVGSWWKQDEA